MIYPPIKYLFAILLVFLTLNSCGDKDETQAIQALIHKGAELAEAHKIGDLMNMTDDQFKGQPGNHNGTDVRTILLGAFHYYGNFGIHFPHPAVSVTEDKRNASALIYFIIVRRDQPIPGLKELYEDPQRWLELAGEKADLYQLKLELIKAKNDWKVQQATLEGFKGLGF
jgi:hypothetical protein